MKIARYSGRICWSEIHKTLTLSIGVNKFKRLENQKIHENLMLLHQNAKLNIDKSILTNCADMNPQSRSWVGKGCIFAVKVLLILGQLGVLLIFLLRVPRTTLLLSAQCQ